MFCINCGAKLDDKANFCNHCGTRVAPNAYQQADSSDKFAATRPTNQPIVPNHNAQVTCSVNLVYPNGRSEIGDIHISATEIIFVKKSKAVHLAFGFVGRALENGEEKLRINVSDIIKGNRTRIGLNSNVYQITLRNGEVYKLCLDNPKKVSYLEGIFG